VRNANRRCMPTSPTRQSGRVDGAGGGQVCHVVDDAITPATDGGDQPVAIGGGEGSRCEVAVHVPHSQHTASRLGPRVAGLLQVGRIDAQDAPASQPRSTGPLVLAVRNDRVGVVQPLLTPLSRTAMPPDGARRSNLSSLQTPRQWLDTRSRPVVEQQSWIGTTDRLLEPAPLVVTSGVELR
jgi:hypothetical protein